MNLKSWEKTEKKLTNLVLAMKSLFLKVVAIITPNKVKNFANKTQKKAHDQKVHFIEKAQHSKEVVKQKFASSTKSTRESLKKAKEKTAVIVAKSKEVNIKKISWKKVFIGFFAAIASAGAKAKSWLLTLKPETVIAAVTISTVGSLTGINVYTQSKKAAEKATKFEQVEKVENADGAISRPGYYKKEERAFKVTNVILPVYLETGKGRGIASKTSSLRKLSIDFTFVSSNRYIKAYFWDNPHLIMDKLNSKIEPIAIDFPLENEGKIIIKEKLLREVNDLLSELKIKGKIEDIYIHSIIGA